MSFTIYFVHPDGRTVPEDFDTNATLGDLQRRMPHDHRSTQIDEMKQSPETPLADLGIGSEYTVRLEMITEYLFQHYALCFERYYLGGSGYDLEVFFEEYKHLIEVDEFFLSTTAHCFCSSCATKECIRCVAHSMNRSLDEGITVFTPSDEGEKKTCYTCGLEKKASPTDTLIIYPQDRYSEEDWDYDPRDPLGTGFDGR